MSDTEEYKPGLYTLTEHQQHLLDKWKSVLAIKTPSEEESKRRLNKVILLPAQEEWCISNAPPKNKE